MKLKDKKISPSVVVIIILVLLLICALVLFSEVNNYRTVKEEKYSFYTYFASQKVDFDGTITYNLVNDILKINTNNFTFTSTPVYFKDYAEQLILPFNYEIVYPYKNSPMYKLGKYSKIYYKGDSLYINFEKGTGRLNDCFLYDGDNTYIFTDATTVFVGEDRYDLSPLSFVEVVNDGYIQIYDRKSDKYYFFENYLGDVSAYTSSYTINLIDDTFTYENLYYVLMKNIDTLKYCEL